MLKVLVLVVIFGVVIRAVWGEFKKRETYEEIERRTRENTERLKREMAEKAARQREEQGRSN